MNSMKTMLFGACGGMCPTLASLASFYVANPNADMPKFGIYIALVLFAALGAVIAAAYGTGDIKAAVIAGISAPGLVTSVLDGAQETPQVDPNQMAALSYFSAPAYAQTFSASGAERLLTLTPHVRGGEVGGDGIAFGFAASDGTLLPGGTNYTGQRAAIEVVVPEGATMLVIGDQREPLAPTVSSADVMIEANPTVAGDLIWALGGKRNYAIGEITVTFGR